MMFPSVQLSRVSQFGKKAAMALLRWFIHSFWFHLLMFEAPIEFYIILSLSAFVGYALSSLSILAFLAVAAVPFIIFLLFEWGPFRPHPCERSWKDIFDIAGTVSLVIELPGIIAYCIWHFLLTPTPPL